MTSEDDIDELKGGGKRLAGSLSLLSLNGVLVLCSCPRIVPENCKMCGGGIRCNFSIYNSKLLSGLPQLDLLNERPLRKEKIQYLLCRFNPVVISKVIRFRLYGFLYLFRGVFDLAIDIGSSG